MWPRRIASTVSAVLRCTITLSRSTISTTTSKVGGALRSRTVFCVPRRRASSSPRVTVWMPPTRSERVGLSIRLSSVLPCAVPTSCTPRSAIVRAAAASSSVPISSMTITSGMWFSTASIITACCSVGDAHLHPPRVADAGVRDVAVAGDLVAGVDHDHALAEVVGEDARHLAQHRRLADAGAPQQHDALPALDDVADDVDRPEDGPPDAAGEPHHLAGPVADGADPMQRALDPGPVVVAEGADVLDHVGDVGLDDLALEQHLLAVGEARLGAPPEVEHHLEQVGAVREAAQARHDLRRQGRQQGVEVVGRRLSGHRSRCLSV